MHQLENGYTKIANTILEELFKSVIPANSMRIILWTIRNSYGFHRKHTKPTSIRQIGEATKMSISSVHLAINVLIVNKILVKNPDGGYDLDKNRIIDFVQPTEHPVQPTERKKAFSPLNKSVQPTEHPVQPTERILQPTERPLLKEERKLKENLIKERETYSQEFSEFWKAYPRKVGKDKAWEAWQKKSPTLFNCLATLKWQVKCQQWTKDEGQFIPHPTTWLNQGRWNDEQPKYQPPSGAGAAAPIPGKYDGIGTKV